MAFTREQNLKHAAMRIADELRDGRSHERVREAAEYLIDVVEGIREAWPYPSEYTSMLSLLRRIAADQPLPGGWKMGAVVAGWGVRTLLLSAPDHAFRFL